MRLITSLLFLPLVLAACSNQGLRDLRTNAQGPDEFMVLPVKPLEAPDSYNTLPAPTPGQANLVDRSAIDEGIAAFGGRPEATGGGIQARDAGLVRHAGRFGVDGNIREDLAERDAQFRKRKERFTQFRLFPVDRYDQAYRREALDKNAEARRWRQAGARTPSAPPAVR